MSKNLSVDIGLLEGRSYIIGRVGHIYIDSPSVSKHHAEISIKNGKVFLRDLGSTNGTYLIRNGKLVYFEKGYVNLLQPLVIGNQKYTVQKLLEIAGSFSVDSDDSTTLVNLAGRTGNR